MWTGHFQSMFMRVSVAVLLILLIIYAVLLMVVEVKTPQSLQSLNISAYFHKAVYEFQKVINRQKTQRKRKLVLLWTKCYEESDWLPSTEDLHCPVAECDATSNRSMLPNSSAVIFHWRSINTTQLPKCVPSETTQCPLWVLYNREAPPHSPRDTLLAIQSHIHWMATYRKDSDIYAPYGKILQKRTRSPLKSDFNTTERSLLCWLVSNCETPGRREFLVGELEKYIAVDIYGKCGNMQCPHELAKDCYLWLSKRCMFYLSLENSFCKDYVTEKLYYALRSDMVPVVFGNSSNYDHLPPRSFINAADFSSLKGLSEYLVTVGKDTNMYKSYFWWKRDYEVQDPSFLWFCDLCEKLHNGNLEDVKSDRNLMSWWFGQSSCFAWEG